MAKHARASELQRAEAPRRAPPHGLREQLGDLVGRWWAPAVAEISRLRRARMFHPVGLTFGGTCEPVDDVTFGDLGNQLAGRVLARCSQALWRNGLERFDVLGIALRFRFGDVPELDERVAPDDQDLLFATIHSPWTMPLSLFTTDATDYFANEYRAVAPFDIGEPRRIKLRLRPIDPMRNEGSRDEKLLAAVDSGRARWSLDARHTLALDWHTIANISFDQPIDLDQDDLRFDPFNAGGGFVPAGFVHAIRRAVYPASQDARPHSH